MSFNNQKMMRVIIFGNIYLMTYYARKNCIYFLYYVGMYNNSTKRQVNLKRFVGFDF